MDEENKMLQNHFTQPELDASDRKAIDNCAVEVVRCDFIVMALHQ